MFTAGRILRNLNRGDPNAGPVNSVLIPQPRKMKDRRKFRCYVPFVWQALMATCIGFLVILIGIALCVVGYYADHIQSLTAPRRLDNITSALSLASREKYGPEGKAADEGTSGRGGGESGAGTTGYNYLRCMIYIGPALMSCGSFAIVFSCVVVCETRDKLLEFMDEREKSNLPRKASLKFDFFRSIVSPTANQRHPRNSTTTTVSPSGIDIVSSSMAEERPKPIRPASLSVTEFDAGQKHRLLLGSETDDRFPTSCREENDRLGSNMGYNAERMGDASQGPEFNPFTASDQGAILDPVLTNPRPVLERFSTGFRRETDVGYIVDYLDAEGKSVLERFSAIHQNHRSTGAAVGERMTGVVTAAAAAPEGFLSVITGPIDRSLRCLPQGRGPHQGTSLVTASALGGHDRDHRSLDGSLSAGWTMDSDGRRGSSGSSDVCRREAGRRASEQSPREAAAAQLPNNLSQRPTGLVKTGENETRTIAQRHTNGPDGLRRGPVDRQGPGPGPVVRGPSRGPSPAVDAHRQHKFFDVPCRNTADSTKASGVTAGRQSPQGVASSRLTSGSLQSISGAIVQFRPQTMAGQRGIHIIHKAHVHQEPRPTFSTLPLRFSQQQ